MKKGEFISIVRQRKFGGLPDRTSNVKADPRIIAKWMDVARRQSLIDNIVECPITDDYLKVFFPYIVWDDFRCIAYFTLPASIVMLIDDQGNNQGLQWVSGKDDENTSWIIRRNGESQYMDNLEGGAHDRQVCYVEGNKVMLPKIKQMDVIGGLCAKIKIVCDTNGYTTDEEFAVPVKTAQFLEMVEKLLDEQKMTPAKTGNDGDVNKP